MTVDALVAELVRGELAGLAKYEVPHFEGIRAKLDANESPHELAAPIAAALGARLGALPLHRYPDGNAGELRAQVAREVGCAPEALVFGNGSDELISLLVSTFCRPRDGAAKARIAYPVPSFVVYRIATLAAGAEPLEIPLDGDFQLDGAALEAALDAGRPNLIFFARPNNPTGTLWSRDVIAGVLARHPDTLVVVDEAYFDYSGETMQDLLPQHANMILLRTLSKVGLAGLRVGYLVADPGLVAQLEKIRPPYNLGSLNQEAAAWLLSQHGEHLRAHIGEVVAERDRLLAGLAELPGVRVFPSSANLFLIRVGTPGDGAATRVWKQLAAQGVLVRNFDRPGPLAGCLRVSVGKPAENDLFLTVLRAAL